MQREQPSVCLQVLTGVEPSRLTHLNLNALHELSSKALKGDQVAARDQHANCYAHSKVLHICSD